MLHFLKSQFCFCFNASVPFHPQGVSLCSKVPITATSHDDRHGITVRSVNLTWPDGRRALLDVSLDVQPGELCMVVGSNGSGKSTLLNAIRGMVSIDDGHILFKPPVSLVRQDPELQMVFPTIGTDVAACIPNRESLTDEEIREIVCKQLEVVGLFPGDDFYDLSSNRVSGGQRQRAVLAAALISQPQTILFDEVTSSLDPIARAAFLDLIRDLVTRQRLSALW